MEGTFIQPLAVDVAAMKRVIEHMLQKRGKDDVIILFDGRSRPARHVFDEYEEKLECHKEKFIELPRRRIPGLPVGRQIFRRTTRRQCMWRYRSATTKYKRAQS